jgi:hypothetical protein
VLQGDLPAQLQAASQCSSTAATGQPGQQQQPAGKQGCWASHSNSSSSSACWVERLQQAALRWQVHASGQAAAVGKVADVRRLPGRHLRHRSMYGQRMLL